VDINLGFGSYAALVLPDKYRILFLVGSPIILT